MNDLFVKPKSKKEQLLEFIKVRHWVKTSEVIDWSREIGHKMNRADRTARDLADEGKIIRMSKDEKLLRFGNIHEDVWVFNG